jgi:hypothetical protein
MSKNMNYLQLMQQVKFVRSQKTPDSETRMIMQRILLTIISTGIMLGVHCPSVHAMLLWSKTYGGPGDDNAYFIQQTSDDGYIVAGRTASFGAGGGDFLVIKLTGHGTIAWQKTFGGAGDDFVRVVRETFAGLGGPSTGYVLAGMTQLTDATRDMLLIQLNPNGDIVWQQRYGGSGNEYAFDVHQVFDAGLAAGYIVGGFTNSTPDNLYAMRSLVLDSSGAVVSDLSLANPDVHPGAQQRDNARTLTPSYDRSGNLTGYVMAGYTGTLPCTDPTGQTCGYYDDVWLVKVTLSGQVVWEYSFGRTETVDIVTQISLTRDSQGLPDGYIVVGYTSSYGIGGTHVETDIMVMRLIEDSQGRVSVAWQKTYGSRNDDYAYSIASTRDGGYVIAGISNWVYGQDPFRNTAVWILKVNGAGELMWAREYGGNRHDDVRSIQQTADGGFVLAGASSSFAANSGAPAHTDAWVLKVDQNGEIPGCVIWSDADITVTDFTDTGTVTSATVRQNLNGAHNSAITANSADLEVVNNCGDPDDDGEHDSAPVDGGGGGGSSGGGALVPECSVSSDCDNAIFCDGEEACINGRCISGSVPCPQGTMCDEETRSCIPLGPPPECERDIDCDDGIFCNGEETCSYGACVQGAAPCHAGQVCREKHGHCLEEVRIPASTSLIGLRKQNVLFRPLYRQHVCTWIRLRQDSYSNFEHLTSPVDVIGPHADSHGIARNTDRELQAGLLPYILWVPICIDTDATPGLWRIEIRTEFTDSELPYIETIYGDFEIR